MTTRDKHLLSSHRMKEYCYLLPICSKYHPNTKTDIQQHCTVICKVENLLVVCMGRQTHTKLSHFPFFIDKFIDYSNWMINLSLDVLVCGITLYFHSLLVFFLVLWARLNTAQLLEIYGDNTHQNI